jgi:hypothetical protein
MGQRAYQSVTCTARSLREFSPSLRLAAVDYLRGLALAAPLQAAA